MWVVVGVGKINAFALANVRASKLKLSKNMFLDFWIFFSLKFWVFGGMLAKNAKSGLHACKH